MTRSEILNTAMQAVTKDRAATHGSAERNFGRIAAIWSIRCGVQISPAQVAIMLVDLKTTRAWDNPAHEDNWVDMAGYAACGGEIATATNTPTENLGFEAHMQRRYPTERVHADRETLA